MPPTVSRGYVSHCSATMLKTTCCVHAGDSGGPILDCEGRLLGITVCNTRLLDTGTVYPRYNMAVPYLAVRENIQEFLYSNGACLIHISFYDN